MECVSNTLITVDALGCILAIEGPCERLSIQRNAVGHQWNQIFYTWGLPQIPLDPGTTFPFSTHISGPTDEIISAEFFRTSRDDENASVSVVFRPELSAGLTARQQQFCGLGELSADIAHEMNNALTLLIGWLELLKADRRDDPGIQSTAELLMGEAERMARLTRNLLEVARDNGEVVHPLDMRTLLTEVLTLVEYEMKSSNIQIQSDLAPQLPCVTGSSGRIKQAVLNLLINARQAMPSGGHLTLSAGADDEGNLRLAVADTGTGIANEIRDDIFNPYFTTKPDGTGLGLHVTKRIVEDLGGQMQLESFPGAGARFTLLLPAGAS